MGAFFCAKNMAAVYINTYNDLLADLSTKVGETTADTSDNRKRLINNAYNFISQQELWWWLEHSSTDTTTTALSYTLPTTFRAFHPRNPVKIGSDFRVLIPFEDLQLYDGSTTTVSLPLVRTNRFAYIYGTSIYFVQASMTASQTITYYYYRTPTMLDILSDEPLIPVQYREMISLYAAGMYLKSQGGPESVEGSDLLQLYDAYLGNMRKEQSSRRKMGIARRALDPEEALIFRR